MNANKRSLFKYLIPLLIFLAFSVAFSYTQITPYLIKVSKIIDVDNPDYFIDLSAPDVSIKTAGGATFTGDVNISGNLTTQNYLCVGGDCVNSLSGLSGIPSGYCVEFYNASCPSGFKLFQNLTEAVKFGYKRKIIITDISHHDIFDYQINITLDTQSLISAGKMRSDCGDIRFYDENNNELSYWIEDGTCGTTQTHIWVKVPYIPASSSTTIYLYYGNPSAESQSDGQAVFEFFDDFNDGIIDNSKWDYVASGSSGIVEEKNGYLHMTPNDDGAYSLTGKKLTCFYNGTYVYTTKIKASESDYLEIGINDRFNDTNGKIDRANMRYLSGKIFEMITQGTQKTTPRDTSTNSNFFILEIEINETHTIYKLFDTSYNLAEYKTISDIPEEYFYSPYFYVGYHSPWIYSDWIFIRKNIKEKPIVSLESETETNPENKVICCKQ